MFDASPLVIAKLREHTYHITGLKSYEYRRHHQAAAAPFASKLARLREEDVSGLFIPEAPELGGFGHTIDGAMVNMDTLKFYEAMIALDRAGMVGRLRATRRPVVLDIGAGWGGFAYQLRRHVPDVTYIIIDLPPTMLFSGTYLRATYPDARMRFYSDAAAETILEDLDDVDFVFLPPYAVPRVTLPPADLAVNIASFQEMTTEQVCGYVRALADAGCRVLYSLNRDRSKWNTELTSVTDIISSRYCIQRIPILNVPYTVLDWKANAASEPSAVDYRHLIGRL
jgi:putative sugar O-methyltransferase